MIQANGRIASAVAAVIAPRPGLAAGIAGALALILSVTAMSAAEAASLRARGFGQPVGVVRTPGPLALGWGTPWATPYWFGSGITQTTTVIIRERAPQPVPMLGGPPPVVIGIRNPAPAAEAPASIDPSRFYARLNRLVREQPASAGPRIVTIDGDQISVAGPRQDGGARIVTLD